MKKGENKQPQYESGGNKSDPHEVLNDGIHYVVTRVTAKNKERVLTAPDVFPRYTFFSFFLENQSSKGRGFFGQGQRHTAFENAIKTHLGVTELLLRGQVQTDEKGKYTIFALFDSSFSRYFNTLEKKELRILLQDILSQIDHDLMESKLGIQLNFNTAYIYYPKRKILRPYKGGRIGTNRFE